jgi:hypothetical protein
MTKIDYNYYWLGVTPIITKWADLPKCGREVLLPVVGENCIYDVHKEVMHIRMRLK